MIDVGFWKGKRVLLTGHTGFKGSWLSIWLASMGAKVVGYGLAPPTDPSMFLETGVGNLLQDIRGDIRNLTLLKSTIREVMPDIAIHMAAQAIVRDSYSDPIMTYSVNVMGTANFLESLRGCDSVRAAVVVTTDKCYENKEWVWSYRENEAMGGYDPYSSSKGCAELIVSSYRQSFFNSEEYGRKHSLALASARAGNVIGGGDYTKDRLIPDIIRSLRARHKVKIRSPYAIRPWQHVLEPLSGYLILAEKLFQHGCQYAEGWNFGPYDSGARSVEWIVRKLCDKIPGSSGFELDEGSNSHEASYLKLDSSKAHARLGWEPCWDLDTALEKLVEWYYSDDEKYRKTLAQINDYSHL